jgi:death-on-curing protein
MSCNWKHLTAAAVRAIHAEVIAATGGSDGLRDDGLLESAVAAPRATFGGEPLMQDACEIAAAYLFYLSRNHPFVDGNKRTALAACLVFLEVNGLLLKRKLSIAAWESLVLDVAASRLDRDQTTRRLRKLLPHGRRTRPRSL